VADLTIKQHDLFPALSVTLSDANGPVDLTAATAVKVIMHSGVTTVTGTMTKAPNQTTTGKGQATYQWVSPDTSVVGTYDTEFEVTWPTALPETFPNDGYKSITIVADLG
jgi:hypothetical protein